MPEYIKPSYGTGWVASALPNWRTAETTSGGSYPWASASNDVAMINKYRKGVCRVTVRTPANAAVPGANVTITQKEHSFPFCTMIDYGRFDLDTGTYIAELVNGPWNSYVARNSHKQGYWERPANDIQNEGTLTETRQHGFPDTQRIQPKVDALKKWRMRRSHVLSYTVSAAIMFPDPPYGTTKASRRAYWRDTHLPAKSAYLKPYVDMFELSNEIEDSVLYVNTGGFKRNDPDFLSDMLYAQDFAHGRPIYINDYQNVTTHRACGEYLLANGVNLHGVCWQGHDRGTSPRGPLHTLSLTSGGAPAPWWTALTESDLNTVAAGTALYNAEAEALSASFANPNCMFHSNWGHREPTWNGSLGYFDASGNPTSRYTALTDKLRSEWWTTTSGSSNGSGYFEFSGFFGEYEVSVTVGGVTKTRRFELAPSMPEEVFVFE